jgi:hypothetical protein
MGDGIKFNPEVSNPLLSPLSSEGSTTPASDVTARLALDRFHEADAGAPVAGIGGTHTERSSHHFPVAMTQSSR